MNALKAPFIILITFLLGDALSAFLLFYMTMNMSG